ncbi:hypothetical protein VNI00_004172 [Paramarasmius palmivorus]|uniref:Uncharacterized protein n=1 Tax=Paramarasmius palmivorus TaxID=297713 RepID=A0AAW0DL00_9AGAR
MIRLTTIVDVPSSRETQATSNSIYIGDSLGSTIRRALIPSAPDSANQLLEELPLRLRQDEVLTTFAVDESSRLMAIVASDEEVGDSRCVYLQDSNSGAEHPDVSPSCHRIDLGFVPLKGDRLDQVEIGQVSIFGDLVGILLGGELMVYNWKTGLCILKSPSPRSEKLKSFTFLSEDIIVTSYFDFLAIDVWYPRSYGKSAESWKCWMTLEFPPLTRPLLKHSTHRSLDFTPLTTLGAQKPGAIVIVQLYIDYFDGTSIYTKPYVFNWIFLHEYLIRTIRIIASWKPLYRADGLVYVLPWDLWGPQISHCFNITKAKLQFIDLGNVAMSTLQEDKDRSGNVLSIKRADHATFSDPEAAAEYDVVFACPVLSALECVEVHVGIMPHKFVVIDGFRRIFGRRRMRDDEEIPWEEEDTEVDEDDDEDEDESACYSIDVFAL